MQVKNDRREPPLRVWALVGARPGDNDQVIALAEALGIPFQVKQLEFGASRLLGPRLLGRSLISLSKHSRAELLNEPPPDLTISAGHRSVPAVRALRQRSAGNMRAIHVGFPRVSPRNFDLVITTPQYPMADHPNLFRMPYALTRAATFEADPTDQAKLEKLPRPASLLVVGGPNIYWKIDRSPLLKALHGLLRDARLSGGSVLVTTSPRTPSSIRLQLAAILERSEVPSLLAAPGLPPPYSSLLDAADFILVTADSVAMVSDAIWTGKPLALIRAATTVLGRIATGISDFLRPGGCVYPQDLRCFWTAIEKIGVTEELALPRTSTREEMERVLSRVRPILEQLRQRDRV